jgi:purine nucleosidase/pyrimidine-specific ribonucleoside hydrolase
MKSNTLKIVSGVAVVLVFLILFGGPIMRRLGFEVWCISGDLSDLQVGPCTTGMGVAPTVTPFPLSDTPGASKIPLIFDDDGSPDGIIALLYFLRNPLFDVRAVTVSQGEAHPHLFAQHISQLLAMMGKEAIPVGFGREAPLEGDNAFPEPWREASDIFFEIPLLESSAAYDARPATDVLFETLAKSTEPMLVFISGTHTNLAEVLRINPDISDNISGVYVMGGSVYVPGNIESDWPEIHNAVAEWNIWADPQAAHEVFASGIPIHLVPLDATDQVTWTAADAQTWTSSAIPETVMAGDLLDWMLQSWGLEAAYIWDLVAAVAATDPRVCPEELLALDVDVDPGPEQGQTIVVDGPAHVRVCLEPDPGQVRALVAYILGQ